MPRPGKAVNRVSVTGRRADCSCRRWIRARPGTAACHAQQRPGSQPSGRRRRPLIRVTAATTYAAAPRNLGDVYRFPLLVSYAGASFSTTPYDLSDGLARKGQMAEDLPQPEPVSTWSKLFFRC